MRKRVKNLNPGKVGKCILISKKGESFRVTRGEVVVSNGTKHLLDTKIEQKKGGVRKIKTRSFGPDMEIARLTSVHFEPTVGQLPDVASKPAL